MILWILVSVAFANPNLSECIERLEKRDGPTSNFEKLKMLKKACQKQLRKDAPTNSPRYEAYYLLCKNYWVKRMKYEKMGDMSLKLKRCHARANRYEESFNQPGSFVCEVQACRGPKEGERCLSKWTKYDASTKKLCHEILAPLKCTMEKFVPRFVRLKVDKGFEQIHCAKI